MIYVANRNIGITGGGDAVVAMEIMDALSSNGMDVATVSMRYQIPEVLNKQFRNVKNFIFPFIPEKEKYSNQKFGSIRYTLKSMQSGLKELFLNRNFSKFPPKLIISNDVLTGQYLLNKYQGSVKFIQVVHALPTSNFFNGSSIDEFIDLLKKADCIVYVSEECERQWSKYDGISQSKSYCIHNCANERIAKEYLNIPKDTIRKQLKMRSDKFYLTSVASFNHEKGLDLLLDAAPKLKKIAPNIEILLIGSDKTEYTKYLKERVKDEDLKFIKILGFKVNAMEYIYASDAFILPSRVEPLGLVILEAMISKTPAFASSVGGIPEMIDHEISGLLFEKENVSELIHCFEKIYLNQDDRNRYADEAWKKYWEKFSKRNFTEQYIELI